MMSGEAIASWEMEVVRRILLLPIALALVVAVVACAPQQGSDAAVGLPAHRSVGELVWLADEWIYFTTEVTSAQGPELWRTRSGAEAEQVDLANLLGCGQPTAVSSVFAVGTRLGLMGRCSAGDALVVAVNPQHPQEREVLLESPILLAHVSISAGLTQGYGDYDVGSCRDLVRLLPAGPVPLKVEDTAENQLRLTVREGGLSQVWESHCARALNGWSALSTDGQTHVFAASSSALASTGEERRTTPLSLYVQHVEDDRAELFATGLVDILALALSPDGRLVALSTGPYADERALILIEVATGRIQEIAKGRYSSVSFSPDLRHVAAVHYRDDGGERVISLIPLGDG